MTHILLPEGWASNPAPTELHPARVRLTRKGGLNVCFGTPAQAGAFLEGWQARLDLQRRDLSPVRGRSALRSQWFRGWDWANTFAAQAERLSRAS
jgi:ribosome modulation factor